MSKYYLEIGPFEDGQDGFTDEDRKEMLEDAGWQNVNIWRDVDDDHPPFPPKSVEQVEVRFIHGGEPAYIPIEAADEATEPRSENE